MACLCQAGCFLRFFIFTQLCFTIAKCTIDCIVELYLLASFDILQIISGLIGFFAIKRSKYCIFANLALSNSFFVLWNTLLIMIYSDVTGKEWLLKVLKLTWNVKNSYFYKNGFICTKIPITSEIKAKLLESKLFDELKVLAATPEDLIRCRINWRMLECTYAGILCAISILIIAMCLVQYKQNKRKNQVNQFTFEAMPKEKPSGPMGYYERRISREELSNTPLIRNDLHLSSNSLATSNVRNNSNVSDVQRLYRTTGTTNSLHSLRTPRYVDESLHRLPNGRVNTNQSLHSLVSTIESNANRPPLGVSAKPRNRRLNQTENGSLPPIPSEANHSRNHNQRATLEEHSRLIESKVNGSMSNGLATPASASITNLHKVTNQGTTYLNGNATQNMNGGLRRSVPRDTPAISKESLDDSVKVNQESSRKLPNGHNNQRSSINRQRPHPRQMRSEEPQQRRNHIKMDPETRMIPMSGAHVPLSRV